MSGFHVEPTPAGRLVVSLTSRIEVLEQAVRHHLDQMYEDDMNGERISWPENLADLVGWQDPDD